MQLGSWCTPSIIVGTGVPPMADWVTLARLGSQG